MTPMPSEINPQLSYYLMLFVLTVILRWIRAYRSRPVDSASSMDERERYRASYLFFGFELVNVSAGVFILLTQAAVAYVGAVIILYVILVVVGFFLEEDRVGTPVKKFGNLLVSLIVLGVTLLAFFKVDGLKGPDPLPVRQIEPHASVEAAWRVAVPYFDMSLNRNFDVEKDPLKSLFVAEVVASTRVDAIASAKSAFYSGTGPAPYLPKARKTAISMIVLEAEIVAERLGS